MRRRRHKGTHRIAVLMAVALVLLYLFSVYQR